MIITDITRIKYDYREALKNRKRSFYDGFNRLCGGYRPGDVVILVGKTGSGKSTIAEMETCYMIDNGVPVAGFFGEHTIHKTRANIYMKLNGGNDVDVVYDEIKKENKYFPKQRTMDALDLYYRDRLFLLSHQNAKTNITKLCNTMQLLHDQKGVGFFVVDNLLTVSPDDNDSNNKNILNAIASIVVEIKNFAKNNGCIVMLLAHPRKLSGDKVNNKISLYDVAGSSDIVNWVDIVWLHHRMAEEGFNDIDSPYYGVHGMIEIAKNREEGDLGIKHLNYINKLHGYVDKGSYRDGVNLWRWQEKPKQEIISFM